MAGELGQKAGRPYSIREDQTMSWSAYNSRWGGGLTQNVSQNAGPEAVIDQGSIALGQISVTARVTVSFELE
jgi:hypothetical protein